MWRCVPRGPVPSVATVSPLLGWYEREISDLFGVAFSGQPDSHRLVLHEGVHPAAPPFDPVYPAGVVMPFEPAESGLPEIESADVQRLPFGPVRADVVESAELIFFYVGEHIIHFHPQLFFKHRGMEKRFEGRSLTSAVVLAERVSGVGSFAHALAFCQAVEQAAGCIVPPRARMLRSLLAELERLYNHLHYLGHLASTTTLKVGEAEGKLLEERAKQINGRLTGSRFLRSLLIPGGLRRDLKLGSWLSSELEVPARRDRDLCRDAGKHQQPSRPADHDRRVATRGRFRSGRHGTDPASLRLRSRSAPRPSLRRLRPLAFSDSGAHDRRRPCPRASSHG